jgi:hypothetical protein
VATAPTTTEAAPDTTDLDTTDVATTTTVRATTTTDATDGTTDATTDDTTGSGGTATAGTGSASSVDMTQWCAVAEELTNQESQPTAAQLTQYQALAPEEIKSDVDPLVQRLLTVPDGDLVAFFNVVGDDAVEEGKAKTDAFEEENCGIDHSQDDELPAGTTREIEDDAARVDVTGVDYAFDFETPTKSGRTSFVLTNNGDEAHFLLVVMLASGVEWQDVLEADDATGMTDGEWETKLAAAGGDEETITFDLEPGNYGMACFVPTADGTPHALLGMTAEFTVPG